jgi:hypothetical protein
MPVILTTTHHLIPPQPDVFLIVFVPIRPKNGFFTSIIQLKVDG